MRGYQWMQSLLLVATICALYAVYLGTRLGRGDRQKFVNEAWIVFSCLTVAIIVLRQFRPTRDGRKRAGYCEKCGYCLTGNVTRTCPECGCKIQ